MSLSIARQQDDEADLELTQDMTMFLAIVNENSMLVQIVLELAEKYSTDRCMLWLENMMRDPQRPRL